MNNRFEVKSRDCKSAKCSCVLRSVGFPSLSQTEETNTQHATVQRGFREIISNRWCSHTFAYTCHERISSMRIPHSVLEFHVAPVKYITLPSIAHATQYTWKSEMAFHPHILALVPRRFVRISVHDTCQTHSHDFNYDIGAWLRVSQDCNRLTWFCCCIGSEHSLPLAALSAQFPQCRAGASLDEPPPELQQLALSFLATFFRRHPLNNNRHNRFRHLLFLQFSSAWPMALSSLLILPLRQPIRPFTTNKALSGPPLHRDIPPVGGFGVVCSELPTIACMMYADYGQSQ